MLLKVYCTSVSAVTACTFDWLTEGRSLIKSKVESFDWQRLLSSVINNKESKTWKMQRKSAQWKVQYMVHESNMENTV